MVDPIKIEKFGGMVPAIDDRLLPTSNAAHAVDAWLFSGNIEPIRSLIPLHTALPTTRSWFRLPKASPSVDNMIDSDWLEFENQNVRVIRSPVSGQDDDGRYYWADGVYPKMITGTKIRAHSPPLALGVPAPDVAPGVTSSGGVSTINDTRGYVYTWVTAQGEEGPPSPPTVHTGKQDDTWHITMTAPAPDDLLNRELTHTRIYRTVVSTQGIATFYFVDEVPIATLAYDDVITDVQAVNNGQLLTLNWTMPPFDLQGLVSMPNGMVAGWRHNEVWFCEPYQPHAWPVQYVIAVPNEIVGLGVHGQSLIILTQGQPYSATGVDPQSMALAIIQPLEPCTSRLSIVNTPNGVLYCSPNGLINITAAGATNITLQRMLKDQWDKIVHLDTLAASIIQMGYYGYSLSQTGVFQSDTFQIDAFQQESHFGTRPGIYNSLVDDRVGVTQLMPNPTEVQNVITDIFNAETMIMRDGVIYLVDIRQFAPYAPYTWRSKIFAYDYVVNLGAAKIYWTPPFDNTFTKGKFRVYAGSEPNMVTDGLPLRFEQDLDVPGQMYRLPSGFKALYWQFEVTGFAIINSIHAAQAARDLRHV
jgi:hypothetical protein